MARFWMATSLIFILALSSPAFAQNQQWVHVRIDKPDEGERVRINVPINLVETILPLVEEKRMQRGKIAWDDKDISIADLRNVWKELRKQGDSEFMSIQNRDTNVRIFTKGNYLMVQPEKQSGKKVDIQIPLNVVDALFSGSGEELNLTAAVQALKAHGSRDIITIQNEEAYVRVWIDEKNVAE